MKRVKPNGTEDVVAPLNTARECDISAVALFEEKILTNPLITSEIFQDFPVTELLKCSLVSKAWNLTCRGILVDRFESYFTLSPRLTIERLEHFYNLISNVVPGHQHPVNGIRIQEWDIWKWPLLPEPYADVIRRIMDQMEVQFVSFDLSELYSTENELQDMFQTLVIPHLRTIRILKIKINIYSVVNMKYLSQQLEVDSMPNLKELNLPSLGRLKLSILRRILKSCPNLKTFRPLMPYQLPTLRSIKKLYLASKLCFNYMHLSPHDLQLLQDYGSLIKHLKIHQISKQARNQYEGDFITRLRPLFSSHLQYKLDRLDVSVEPLVAILLQHNFPPLRNLKELCCEGGEIWFSCLIKNKAIQFANFLPNLKSLIFSFTGRYSRWLGRKYASEDLRNPISLFECKIPASLDSVTRLKLDGRKFVKQSLMTILDLDEVFPFVTYLDIQMSISGLEDLLKWICESWGDLLQVLILREAKCFKFGQESPYELDYEWGWGNLQESKRKPLPAGVRYSDKLPHLQRLELEFRHPDEYGFHGDEGENIKVQQIFEPHGGQKVQLTLWGCRARMRMKSVKPGVSVYDTVLALQSCPRNSEISGMTELIGTKSICRNICKMLPVLDLRMCCFINRDWNAVAKEVLHHHSSFTLSIRVRDMEDFLFWALGREQKLYNCLKLILGTEPISQDIDYAENVTQVIEKLGGEGEKCYFKMLQVPNLDIEYRSYHNKLEPSMLRAQVVKLFQTFLAKLELNHVQTLVTPIENFDELFRDAEGKLLVLNLRNIKFADPHKLLKRSQMFRRLMEDLKSLERIEVAFSNKLLPHVSAFGKGHCVKHIQLYDVDEQEILLSRSILSLEDESKTEMSLEDPRTALASLLKFAQEQQPLVETITVGDLDQLNQENEPVFGKLFRLLCTSSYQSLQTLHLSLPILHLISKVFTLPLVTVRRIELRFDRTDSDRLLYKIPFSQMVPNLEIVELTCSVYYWIQEFTNEQESGTVASFNPCVSVKSLKIEVAFGGINPDELIASSSQEPWKIDYVAGVFPHVIDFCFFSGWGSSRIRSGNGFSKMLGSPWKAWPSLEIVKIFAFDIDAIPFESWVLGISEEEWGVWKEVLDAGFNSDYDLVEVMQYAPSSFSFRNCKNLKGVRMQGSISNFILKRTRDNWEEMVRLRRN